MTKRELREQVRLLKACNMPFGNWNKEALLLRLEELGAKTVLLYHSLPDEVDTQEIIDAANCRVLLPVVVGDNLELRTYTGKTQAGAYGIEEPVGPVFTDYEQIDAAIIPGMAFTKDGKRLGRGKGYYDRLLPRLTRCHKIGLCFDFQLLADIPTDERDVAMDEVWVV